jgi:hypothetical protein
MIRRGSSSSCVAFPVLLFGDFSEPFVVIFVVEFCGCFLARFLLGVTYEDFVPLWLVTLPQEFP